MIRFGIMGAGSIANKMADAIIKTEGAELVGVASKSYERALEWSKNYPGIKAYESYEHMLSDSEVDLVYIATTNNYHFENINMCLNSGKNVLCEKPMVMTGREAQAVIKLAREKNLFLMEGMWSRLMPKSAKVMEWIAEDKVGNVKLMQGNIGWVASEVYNKRIFMPELGGGSLYDLGVYPIELFTYYARRPVQAVEKSVVMHPSGVDDLINVSLDMGGCLANFQCSFTTKLPEFGYVYGDKGYIKIPSLHMGNSAYLYNLNDELVDAYEGDLGENGFIYEVQEVVSCLEAGLKESSICPLSMTLESARVFDEVRGR